MRHRPLTTGDSEFLHSQTGFVRDGHEKGSKSRGAGLRLDLLAAIVEQGITVRDTVTKAGCQPQLLRRIAIDGATIRQHVKGRAGIIWRAPTRVGHPVGRQIDAFLYAQKEVETGKVPVCR